MHTKRLAHIEQVEIKRCWIEDDDTLAALSHTRFLHLVWLDLSHLEGTWLTRMPNLRDLAFAHVDGLSTASLDGVSLASLVFKGLEHHAFSAADDHLLARLAGLRELCVSFPHPSTFVGSCFPALRDAGLTKLYLADCHGATDENVSTLTTLEEITLTGSFSKLSGRALRQMPALGRVTLHSSFDELGLGSELLDFNVLFAGARGPDHWRALRRVEVDTSYDTDVAPRLRELLPAGRWRVKRQGDWTESVLWTRGEDDAGVGPVSADYVDAKEADFIREAANEEMRSDGDDDDDGGGGDGGGGDEDEDA